MRKCWWSQSTEPRTAPTTASDAATEAAGQVVALQVRGHHLHLFNNGQVLPPPPPTRRNTGGIDPRLEHLVVKAIEVIWVTGTVLHAVVVDGWRGAAKHWGT